MKYRWLNTAYYVLNRLKYGAQQKEMTMKELDVQDAERVKGGSLMGALWGAADGAATGMSIGGK